MTLYRQFPRHRGLDLIAWSPGAEVWRQSQAGQLFYRLVRRTIFAETDGVVGIDHDLPRFHQRRHTRRVAGIFDEHQEGGSIRYKPAVVGDAVGDGRHPEFTYAVVNIVARRIFFS